MRPMAEKPQRSSNLASLAWEQYGGDLHRYLVHRLHNAQDARDLAQEVYLRLLRSKEDNIRDFRAYLYRIASNVVYEYKFRGRDRLSVTFDSETVQQRDEHPQHVLADPMGDQISTERQLEALFRELPAGCQAVFLLYMRDGLSSLQIAQRLGISRHTAKKYISRALATLETAKRIST